MFEDLWNHRLGTLKVLADISAGQMSYPTRG